MQDEDSGLCAVKFLPAGKVRLQKQNNNNKKCLVNEKDWSGK